MAERLPHAIRRARPSDVGLVMSSWVRSYSACLSAPERRAGYATAQREIIATLLEDSTVLMATAEDDDDALYGWVAGEHQHGAMYLHYIYVKSVYRRAGVARSLFGALRQRLGADGANVVVTHMTLPSLAEFVEAREWGKAYRLPLYRTIARKVGTHGRHEEATG